ncbi:MAG: Stp1/IreP family PP2C-type Ser/Thr phosphatase [Clostridia bacterium]
MEYYELSDKGRQREQNQDAFCSSVQGKYPVFVLCDGMGGHRAGEVASAEAASDIVKTMEDLMAEDDGNLFVKIISAMNHANRRVYSMSLENAMYRGMGTTCDTCVISGDGVHIGHVGDSRVYIFTEGGLFQITKDHSLVEEMIEQGSLTRDEALTYEQRNYITRALGTQDSVQTDTYLASFKQGDIILMCSDGLTNMVAEIDIAYILSSHVTLEEKAKRLVELANDNGGRDNITVVLIRK